MKERLEPTAHAQSMRVETGGPLFSDPNSHRFDAALAQLQAVVDRAPPGHEGEVAKHELALSHAAASQGRSYVGWEHLQAAKRIAVAWMTDEERRFEALTRGEEATQKLKGWRLRTAEAISWGFVRDDGSLNVSIDGLRALMELLDGSAQNRHFTMHLVRRQLLVVGALLLSAVVALLFVDVSSHLRGALLGVTGALMSMVLVLRKPALSAIPELRASLEISLLRPVLGATSGLVISLLLKAGGTATDGAVFVAACFLAGFSERFFLSRLEDAVGEKRAEKEE